MSGVTLLVVVVLGQIVCALIAITVLFFLSDAVLHKEALAGICEQRNLLQTHDGTVSVVSARSLSPKRKAILIKVLCDQTGMDASQLVFRRDPALWAGLIVSTADHVLDFSLRGRLRRALNER